MDTDLYDVAKAGSRPCSLAVSPSGDQFAVSTADRLVRLFHFGRGRLTRKYDEALKTYSVHTLRMMSFSSDLSVFWQQVVEGMAAGELTRRLAVERELGASEVLPLCNLAFDESGYYLIYASLVGMHIYILNLYKPIDLLGV
jgi:peptidylprolyl isomerase domain and WD repeat-containing protein 1